ncbi:VOC family protein [Paenibacillus sacheonensis]|uniref:Glyoxalase n=1 Tax=Paenibacillus sacheonensis TaxID=742054 RepID=A0A7X4YU49_9BACL|nr:VOC family protein [Paenibacillus sacheonensis]MBM7568994.1 catechol 2,3-dioxygenase-like lactoylglutathione lyase family enzyme [Paenibacillus sacheonensis]NBC72635.1 glyoxalase [Paenibacillus sacheonensis]
MSFSFIGIDHVQLAAPEGCEPAAREFFGTMLGWPEIPKPEPLLQRGGAWFQCGAQQVHVGVQRDFVPATKAHPAFIVSSLDGLIRHLEGRGIAITLDDARDTEGVRRFFLNDPFGNRLEFME